MIAPTRIDTAHIGHADFVSTIPAGAVADGLDYSAELVARVHAEADAATRMPWWFWEAAIAVFVGAIAASAVWPMGVAP
ncbi:MAG: hypothetical protein IPM99_18975 [Rubrivivax sp.]|nr:hypothetical protein [Rubrivivax sp.]